MLDDTGAGVVVIRAARVAATLPAEKPPSHAVQLEAILGRVRDTLDPTPGDREHLGHDVSNLRRRGPAPRKGRGGGEALVGLACQRGVGRA